MENLKEQIKLLVELQGLDTQIFRMEDELAAIPETIKATEEMFKEKSVSLKKAEDEMKALLVKRKEKEGELEGKEGTIKKYQQQLNQVKTNKEYSALQEEINRVRADNSIIEEAIINIFDQIDAQNKNIAKEKELLKTEEGKFAEEKKKLMLEADKIKAALDLLKKQREELAVKVDKKILQKYEKIVRNKDGLAVVPIKNDACQGCFRILPPQVINEARMHEALVLCDSCARILYSEE